jgi:hypothetical protein
MHDTEFPHDHDEAYGRAVEIEGIEKLTLTSVGIDIGSLSGVALRNMPIWILPCGFRDLHRFGTHRVVH